MRKRIKGKVLSRTKAVRNALLSSLMRSLIIKEHIQTTEAKAKAIRPKIEKLITYAKSDKEEMIRFRYLKKYFDDKTIKRLIKDVSTRYKDRPGGYTRIIKLAPRVRDKASMAVIELV